MTDFEVSRTISKPVRGAIIAMLVLAFVVAFIPLWQLGVSSSGAAAVVSAETRIVDEDREGRALKAAIAAGVPIVKEDFVVSAGNSYQS